MLGGVVFSTLRTFLADNAGIGLCSPAVIEWVIRIGSKPDLAMIDAPFFLDAARISICHRVPAGHAKI